MNICEYLYIFKKKEYEQNALNKCYKIKQNYCILT